MAMSDQEKTELVNSIAESYQHKVIAKLGDDLEGFYVFGSYAFGKISLDKPDVNYFLLLKEGVDADVFLRHAEVLRSVTQEFQERATVMADFRPFRFIYPTKRTADYDVFLCPQMGRMEDRHPPVPFGWGWVFQGVLQTKRLLHGNDALSVVRQPPVTYDYIKRFFPSTFQLLWLPLERAPLQYALPEEASLLMHESCKTAQDACCGFGVNLALNDVELRNNVWLSYVSEKEKLVGFYRERYDDKAAQNVQHILDVRANWLEVKDDPNMAVKTFQVAIELVTAIKAKYVERFTTEADRETATLPDEEE
jgi:predicted nucleotidyltransferase